MFDFRGLASFAKAVLVQAEVIGLNPGSKMIYLKDRPPISYDVVSLDIGHF